MIFENSGRRFWIDGEVERLIFFLGESFSKKLKATICE